MQFLHTHGFKIASLFLLGMVFAIISLWLLQYFGVITFVEQGRQTFWGIIFFLLTWPTLSTLVISTFEQMAGMATPFVVVIFGLGIVSNAAYAFGIGAVVSLLIPKNPFTNT